MSKKPDKPRICITGFMGVGKSTVARHLARIVDSNWTDLDSEIEKVANKSVTEIVSGDGIERFRELETEILGRVLREKEKLIISLGGGAFTSAVNRNAIKKSGVTSIWLEASFDHCWANIRTSYKDRPLGRDRNEAKSLFNRRIKFYSLADWHFVVRPGWNSFKVSEQIAEEVFGVDS